MSRTGIIDTHAHLDDARFDSDRDQLIEKLGLELDAVINQGCTLASSAASIALAEKYPFIYAAVGIHPEDLATVKDDSYLDQLAKWAAHPKVVAIGEIGLDYYWKENEPREVQLLRLRQQVDLARQVHLPVVIHDREAHGDSLAFFLNEGQGVPTVFHCFSGSLEMARELWKRGIYTGFGGSSTFKNSKKVRAVLSECPAELLLFETDCPYLTPEPYRGQRNNPAYTELVVKNAALLRKTTPEALAAQSTRNAHTLFTKLK
jgi:TatD DNase family protein